MRIIITGGTGLIGSKLAADLAQDGHEVIVLSRNPAKYSFPAGVRGEQWDATTAVGWGHLADGADAIINLAGASIAGDGLIPSRWNDKRKQIIRDSRVNAGKAVIEAITAATNKPKVLIQSSGIDYYGESGDDIITEESPAGDGFLAQLCVDWEASTAVAETMGVRRIIIRTGVVLSMDGGALPITALPYKFFVGGKLGSGNQWWPWIHIDDEVAAIRFLLENETAQGAFNLSAPNPLQNKTFGKTIGTVLRRPSLIPVPAFALKLALGEVSTIVLDGQRAIPKKLQTLNFPFQYPEAQPALTNLLS